MTEVDEFLDAVVPRLVEADTALHNGDAAPRRALWSHEDPVTLFGAAITTHGWPAVSTVFGQLADTFSDCTAYDCEVLAAGTSGDLGYLVAIERVTLSMEGGPPRSIALRATTVFRREDGAWKAVHRHGDPGPSDTYTWIVEK
ncbi:nuclear transport factor 2 family protein [Actinomycetospora endophytica]|uniref:Nuclear transport factor 2 family protein n=1 Tax=Actinomycetospora endophytica TaxID=2291215 RepID=A0ABS8PEI0_9PSEU|nr:nuclear transport factor 2 family protein [Actinomycetospora endophytica]MCD2195399.1 nuclear transport factor 2 family protein [Actinomycetospora endophytica]